MDLGLLDEPLRVRDVERPLEPERAGEGDDGRDLGAERLLEPRRLMERPRERERRFPLGLGLREA